MKSRTSVRSLMTSALMGVAFSALAQAPQPQLRPSARHFTENFVYGTSCWWDANTNLYCAKAEAGENKSARGEYRSTWVEVFQSYSIYGTDQWGSRTLRCENVPRGSFSSSRKSARISVTLDANNTTDCWTTGEEGNPNTGARSPWPFTGTVEVELVFDVVNYFRSTENRVSEDPSTGTTRREICQKARGIGGDGYLSVGDFSTRLDRLDDQAWTEFQRTNCTLVGAGKP